MQCSSHFVTITFSNLVGFFNESKAVFRCALMELSGGGTASREMVADSATHTHTHKNAHIPHPQGHTC